VITERFGLWCIWVRMDGAVDRSSIGAKSCMDQGEKNEERERERERERREREEKEEI
jgi:hypothetical protein